MASLEQVAAELAQNMGDLSRVGAHITVDGLDEAGIQAVSLLPALMRAGVRIRFAANRQGLVISANRLGKAKTVIQTVAIIVLIATGDPTAAWVQALVGLTVGITVLSGLVYAVNYYGGRREPVAQPTA